MVCSTSSQRATLVSGKQKVPIVCGSRSGSPSPGAFGRLYLNVRDLRHPFTAPDAALLTSFISSTYQSDGLNGMRSLSGDAALERSRDGSVDLVFLLDFSELSWSLEEATDSRSSSTIRCGSSQAV